MNFTKQEKEGKAFVKIKGAMSIEEAAELGKALLESITENSGLELDLSEVDDCDTAGIQLLCSAGKTARASKKTFSVTACSDYVKYEAESIGLNLDTV